MDNEMINNENDFEVNGAEQDSTVDSGSKSGVNPDLAKLIVLGTVIGVGVIAYKCRHKWEEWRVKRWQKKGYVMYKEEAVNPNEIKGDFVEKENLEN